jgi:hypothetical protein
LKKRSLSTFSTLTLIDIGMFWFFRCWFSFSYSASPHPLGSEFRKFIERFEYDAFRDLARVKGSICAFRHK